MENKNIWAVEYSSQLKWLRVDLEDKIFEWEYYARLSGQNLGFLTYGRGYESKETAIAAARDFILTYQLDLSGTAFTYL